jgi:ribosomal protein S18 acetylase RimI-like enzyme
LPVLNPQELLAVYDDQLRTWLPDPRPESWTVETDGPVYRIIEDGQRGFVGYRSVAGLTGAELDALIARQRDYFAALGQDVEWKYHSHDEPADLPERLAAAGFVPEDRETVVIGLAAPLASSDAAFLRHVTSDEDLQRIVAMEESVWDEDRSHLAPALAAEIAADPEAITIVVAEVDGEVVSAGWVRYVPGTAFATLWGGATRPAYRQRGIYSALVRHRAALAVARGFTHLQVDASDNSRPILERLGFVPVTTTIPYVHSRH